MKINLWKKVFERLALIALMMSSLLSTILAPAKAVSFTPPEDNNAPQQSTGGASRGNWQFVPPSDNSAPQQSTGGASRDFGFIPPADNAVPHSNTSGGASRNGFNFIPPPDSAAPRTSSGGASRDIGFIPPLDNATPSDTAGGASRTNSYGTNSLLFQAVSDSMLAITPNSFYGQTLTARPMFMAYVPPSTIQQAVFSLKDEEQNLVFEQIVAIPAEGGVMAIQLSESAPELEIGQNYQWFLTLKVDAQITPASPFVDAWVKRIAPTEELADLLASDYSLENAETLAQNGIWYDTAAILASHQAVTSTQDIAESWSELLTSVGLSRMAEAPIIVVNVDE
ncbi:MAG: DUF928 domain-containing protein [Cyanobacteria bacterium P01_D01_bin.156]